MRLTVLSPRAKGKLGGQKVAKGLSIPAPVEGWDASTPLAAMPPKRAIVLDNWFPQPGWVELRKGYIEHSDTDTNNKVDTIAAYQGPATTALFAAAGSVIYNVTVNGGTAISAVTGMGSARWQHINFAGTGGNFLYMVNGVDAPHYYNGTSWAAATITGMPAQPISVEAFKKRLWFCVPASSTAYYLPVDSIQGAAVAFPFGGYFTKGGYLMAIGTWSLDAGNGPDDYLVALSIRGQVAIYTGTDPATDFTQVGVFDLGVPIGRRCMYPIGADLAIVCQNGVYPLSKAMIVQSASVVLTSITERIFPVINAAGQMYSNNFGWQLIAYPRGTRAILNVPLEEGSQQQQYVMNTLNGAWCRFTGMNANCWEVYEDRLFFGGNDGVIYEADVSAVDNDTALRADMQTAFNYYGNRGLQKRWMMCRPQLTTDTQVNPGMAFNTDFATNAPIYIPSTPSSVSTLWDVAKWDVDQWGGGQVTNQAFWTSVAAIGYCASIRMVVDVEPSPSGSTSSITLQVNAFDTIREDGAMVG